MTQNEIAFIYEIVIFNHDNIVLLDIVPMTGKGMLTN